MRVNQYTKTLGIIPLPAGLAVLVLPSALSMYRDQYTNRVGWYEYFIPPFALDPEGVDG